MLGVYFGVPLFWETTTHPPSLQSAWLSIPALGVCEVCAMDMGVSSTRRSKTKVLYFCFLPGSMRKTVYNI